MSDSEDLLNIANFNDLSSDNSVEEVKVVKKKKKKHKRKKKKKIKKKQKSDEKQESETIVENSDNSDEKQESETIVENSDNSDEKQESEKKTSSNTFLSDELQNDSNGINPEDHISKEKQLYLRGKEITQRKDLRKNKDWKTIVSYVNNFEKKEILRSSIDPLVEMEKSIKKELRRNNSKMIKALENVTVKKEKKSGRGGLEQNYTIVSDQKETKYILQLNNDSNIVNTKVFTDIVKDYMKDNDYFINKCFDLSDDDDSNMVYLLFKRYLNEVQKNKDSKDFKKFLPSVGTMEKIEENNYQFDYNQIGSIVIMFFKWFNTL